MKGDKNIEDPVSRKRLRRKVLERWENEGGRICTEPGIASQRRTPLGGGTQTPVSSQAGSVKKIDSSPQIKK